MADLYDPVCADPEAFINRYVMMPELWEKFDVSDLDVDISLWGCAKMLNDSGDDISMQTSAIPTEYGGIYVYVIRPPVIPTCGEYIMYVGKATKTSSENLRRRVRSYKSEIGENYGRDKIHRMFYKWGDYVYVRYLPVPAGADVIGHLEDRLIAALNPPCNSDIRISSVKRAIKAFS